MVDEPKTQGEKPMANITRTLKNASIGKVLIVDNDTDLGFRSVPILVEEGKEKEVAKAYAKIHKDEEVIKVLSTKEKHNYTLEINESTFLHLIGMGYATITEKTPDELEAERKADEELAEVMEAENS